MAFIKKQTQATEKSFQKPQTLTDTGFSIAKDLREQIKTLDAEIKALSGVLQTSLENAQKNMKQNQDKLDKILSYLVNDESGKAMDKILQYMENNNVKEQNNNVKEIQMEKNKEQIFTPAGGNLEKALKSFQTLYKGNLQWQGDKLEKGFKKAFQYLYEHADFSDSESLEKSVKALWAKERDKEKSNMIYAPKNSKMVVSAFLHMAEKLDLFGIVDLGEESSSPVFDKAYFINHFAVLPEVIEYIINNCSGDITDEDEELIMEYLQENSAVGDQNVFEEFMEYLR